MPVRGRSLVVSRFTVLGLPSGASLLVWSTLWPEARRHRSGALVGKPESPWPQSVRGVPQAMTSGHDVSGLFASSQVNHGTVGRLRVVTSPRCSDFRELQLR